MTAILRHYLNDIRNNLRLDRSTEKEVITELETHIEDRLQEMRQAGLSEEEAANKCVKLLGSAKLVARQIYEIHSQGSWRQALLASMPHLIFALLFILNWWHGISVLPITLILTLGIAIYGWCHNKPSWLFPWLGFSLLPVLVAGLLLLYLPKIWSWLAIALYIPLALWLICSVMVQTIKRDWLYSSLTLLPIPIIVGWCLAVEVDGRFPELSIQRVHYFAPWIGLSFLALATAVITFVRLRQRCLKIAMLVISGLLTLTMVAYYANGRLGLTAFSILIIVMLGIFLSPALAERKIRKRELTTRGICDARSSRYY